MTVKNNINWPAVEKFIDEYSNSYEMIGEDEAGREGTYNPSEIEIYMISDAIRGLLDDEEFLALIQPSPAESDKEAVRNALFKAEAALADIGDAEREPGDNLQWCERRAAEVLPLVRAALKTHPAHPSEPSSDIPWDNFPGYLIDHHEGDVITEELLQFALAGMLKESSFIEPAQPSDSRTEFSDTEMLDWLASKGYAVADCGESYDLLEPHYGESTWLDVDSPTPREAIKAAMRAERDGS